MEWCSIGLLAWAPDDLVTQHFRCSATMAICGSSVLRPRAYRAVAGVGVRDVHNLRDGSVRFQVLMTFNTNSVRFLSVDDLLHFLFGNIG